MRRILYLIKRILKMDYKGLFKTVKSVHKKSGVGRIKLFIDIVKCGLKYGAGYKDYELCEWWNLNAEQRATYVTRGINNTIVTLLNNKEYYHILDNKIEFNNKFGEYLGRKWLDMSIATIDDFKAFLEGLDTNIWQVATTAEEAVELLFNTPNWDKNVRKFAAI